MFLYIYNKRNCAVVSFTQGVDTLAFLSSSRAVAALPGYKPRLVDLEGRRPHTTYAELTLEVRASPAKRMVPFYWNMLRLHSSAPYAGIA